jgi:hypothetical protein
MVIDRFYFSDGESAGDLKELFDKLKVIDDECFGDHVNEGKNDFANWISGALNDKILANKVGPVKDKEKIISIIGKKVNNATSIKNRIIAKIKEEILHGSS